MDLGGVDTLRCGYLGDLNLGGWIWEALIRLEVGVPLRFVSGDIQYAKRRKFDEIHVSLRLFFLFPRRRTGLSGIFVDCNPLAVMALILVLAASEHLGELNLGGVGSGRC